MMLVTKHKWQWMQNVSYVWVVVLIGALFLSGWLVGSSAMAHQGASVEDSDLMPVGLTAVASLETTGGATWVSCTPTEVAVFDNRIHIRCNESYSGIQFFAIATGDAASSARFLSLLTTAQVAGRTLSLLYDPADTSGDTWGCVEVDCRPLQAAAFGQ